MARKKEQKAPQVPAAAVVTPAVKMTAEAPAEASAGASRGKTMTLWLRPEHSKRLDEEVARTQAQVGSAAKVSRSSYVMHALLTHLDAATKARKS